MNIELWGGAAHGKRLMNRDGTAAFVVIPVATFGNYFKRRGRVCATRNTFSYMRYVRGPMKSKITRWYVHVPEDDAG